MNKNLGTRTATTFNLPFILFPDADPEATAELVRPYVWKSETEALIAVGRLDKHSDGHEIHHAPGLEVHAFYVAVPGRDALELYSVIVFEDDTAVRLHRAVRKAQPVTVSYVRADGEEIVRTIEPRSLKLTKGGDVIVKALDRQSGEHRSFRLDRLLFLTVHRTWFLVEEPVKIVAAPAPVEPVVGFTLWAGEFYGTVDGQPVTPGTNAKAQALAGAYASRRTLV